MVKKKIGPGRRKLKTRATYAVRCDGADRDMIVIAAHASDMKPSEYIIQTLRIRMLKERKKILAFMSRRISSAEKVAAMLEEGKLEEKLEADAEAEAITKLNNLMGNFGAPK